MAKIEIISVGDGILHLLKNIPWLVHAEFSSKELLDEAVELGFNIEEFEIKNGQKVLIKE